ncbi:helix-turn-helix domain-containing protein [Neisseria sp.]|uniref:helix-turn-helix domain-containing protein n=1 Tax=Neisseria sp. TaxID=192066 RepID=UPI0035A119B0
MKYYTLKDWLGQRRGRLKQMAEDLDMNYSWISQIASGTKKAPLETALKISAYTNNEVTVEAIHSAYKKKSTVK